jgi:hypothetical protein
VDADEWLNDSEEQMQAEDAVWEAAYARHKDKFLTLRDNSLLAKNGPH